MGEHQHRLVSSTSFLSTPVSSAPAIVCLYLYVSHCQYFYVGVSNRWTGIWNGTVEWKMEWNGECTQL